MWGRRPLKEEKQNSKETTCEKYSKEEKYTNGHFLLTIFFRDLRMAAKEFLVSSEFDIFAQNAGRKSVQ